MRSPTRSLLRLLLLLLLAARPLAAQPAADERPAPLVLQAPIDRWDEAVPLGNGITGGLLWGEGRTLRLSLDRGDLWDERLPDVFRQPDWTYQTIQRLVAARDQDGLVARFDAPYETFAYPTKLPGARLEITLAPTQQARAFSLDLYEATGRVDLGDGALEAFFSAQEPVALLRLTGPAPEAFRLVRPASLDALGYAPARSGEDGREAWFVQEAAQGFSYAVVVAQQRVGDEVLMAVATGSSEEAADPLALGRARVAAALDAGYERLRRDHLRWWQAFWATSHVAIPDSALQHHYDLVKYFYGAASRPDAPPIPLQGVWTADEGTLPPWKGDYHNDLNTQMTYLPYHAAGLVDAGRSFLDFNWKLLPQYRAFAWSFFGVPGAAVPGVMTLKGQAMGGWSQYSLSPTNGAWVAHSFYLHWRYTMDEAFLRERAYPFCEAVGTALRALLAPAADGTLKLPLSSSPEIHNNSLDAWLAPNSNYDLALMQWLFGALAEMARALDDDAAAAGWEALLARLEPLHVEDEAGSLVFAAGDPYRSSHRHFSHAMAIHPFDLLHVEGTPRDRQVVQATVDRMLAEGTNEWTGYSFSWMASMLARVGRAEEALAYLRDYERAFILRNGFHVNGDQSGEGLSDFTYRPFTLEGNFLAMDAVHEMLLQSWGGVVRVFPAVSRTWADVSFRDLRAQGAFRVSAERRGGKTTAVRVAAAAGGVLTLRDPFDGARAAWSRDDVRFEDGHYLVSLRPGEVLSGTPAP